MSPEIFFSQFVSVSEANDGTFDVTVRAANPEAASSGRPDVVTAKLSVIEFQELSWALYAFECKKKHRRRKHRRNRAK